MRSIISCQKITPLPHPPLAERGQIHLPRQPSNGSAKSFPANEQKVTIKRAVRRLGTHSEASASGKKRLKRGQ